MTTRVQPQDKTVTVGGLKLHYLDWGAAGKPLMVLLHGLRGNAHSWDDVSAAMCQEYHVLALDVRGRGQSDWAKDGDYTIGAYVADVAGFREVLNLEPFVLMGHSMGGRISMAFTGRHPEAVRQLILADVGPAIDSRGLQRVHREMNSTPEEFDSFDAVVEHTHQETPNIPDAVLRRRLKYSTKELPNGKVGWSYDAAIRAQRRQEQPSEYQRTSDLWPDFRNITCPTLIVRAVDTDILSPEVAKEMVEAIPNGRLVQIQRAGHWVFEDNAADYIAEVRRFLR